MKINYVPGSIVVGILILVTKSWSVSTSIQTVICQVKKVYPKLKIISVFNQFCLVKRPR